MSAHVIPDAATDTHIDPAIRSFLAEVNKDASPYWLLPGDEVRATLAGLQATADRDLSGVTVEEKDIEIDGVAVKIYIQRPAGVEGPLPVILFLHGGVWIAGDFNNHQGLSRDLAVGPAAPSCSWSTARSPTRSFPPSSISAWRR
jgi:acetyl esterase/lipase